MKAEPLRIEVAWAEDARIRTERNRFLLDKMVADGQEGQTCYPMPLIRMKPLEPLEVFQPERDDAHLMKVLRWALSQMPDLSLTLREASITMDTPSRYTMSPVRADFAWADQLVDLLARGAGYNGLLITEQGVAAGEIDHE